jgi:hypothetical protein
MDFFIALMWSSGRNQAEVRVAMAASASGAEYFVWGTDKTAYGPVDLPTLISWVEDERITAETWIFFGDGGAWTKAAALPELGKLFGQGVNQSAGEAGLRPAGRGVEPQALRRIRILATLTDEQLERFAQFAELVEVPEATQVVTQGERDDTLYLILDGAMSVRVKLMGAEALLTTLGVGECFGDLALLDKGPRSADVVAVKDSLLVRVSSAAFERLSREAPEVATSVLRALDTTLTERIRADNQRYGYGVLGTSGRAVPPRPL